MAKRVSKGARAYLGFDGENILDLQFKLPGDFEGQRQARIIAFILDCVDRLPADSENVAQFLLRESSVLAQFLELVFQRSLQKDQAALRA